jgi:hypothetical protein
MAWLTPLYAAIVPTAVTDRPAVEQKSLSVKQKSLSINQKRPIVVADKPLAE